MITQWKVLAIFLKKHKKKNFMYFRWCIYYKKYKNCFYKYSDITEIVFLKLFKFQN